MGTLTVNTTNKQYKKYTYKYGNTSYSNIHVFTTKSTQSITPAISTTKVALADINPASVASKNVIAKINGNMFDYGTNNFYGFFYQGKNYPMYTLGEKITSLPKDNSEMYKIKFWPSFCVKTDGTAVIRWFESKSAVEVALKYCKCVIGAVHPLVFNSKCVLNELVYDSEPNKKVIYDPNGKTASKDYHFKDDTGNPSGKANRTLLGHKSDGIYVMVCTDSKMNIKVAANLMYDMGCDYAVAMDGGSPYQMRIKSSYGPTGKVTSGDGTKLHTAVCAHT